MAQRSKLNRKAPGSLGLVGLILSTGSLGFLLTSSVVTSGFFEAANHLRMSRFLSFEVLGALGFVGVVFLSGLTLTFVASQSANDLWSTLCAKHNLTKRDFYALVIGCGSIGFLFDKAILTGGLISTMLKLSYAQFCSPKIFPQVVIVALVAVTGVVMSFIASKSATQLWKIYSSTGPSRQAAN